MGLPADDPAGLFVLYRRFIVTSHCAYDTDQASRRMAEMAVQNLIAVANGADSAYPIPGDAH